MQKEQQQHQHQQLICHLKLFVMRPVGDISPWPASILEQLNTRQKEAVAEDLSLQLMAMLTVLDEKINIAN